MITACPLGFIGAFSDDHIVIMAGAIVAPLQMLISIHVPAKDCLGSF